LVVGPCELKGGSEKDGSEKDYIVTEGQGHLGDVCASMFLSLRFFLFFTEIKGNFVSEENLFCKCSVLCISQSIGTTKM